MTTLHLVPHLTGTELLILGGLGLIPVAGAVLMIALEHLATEWQAAQYDAGQSPMEGQITRRTFQPRVPTQRQPDHDQDGGVA